MLKRHQQYIKISIPIAEKISRFMPVRYIVQDCKLLQIYNRVNTPISAQHSDPLYDIIFLN